MSLNESNDGYSQDSDFDSSTSVSSLGSIVEEMSKVANNADPTSPESVSSNVSLSSPTGAKKANEDIYLQSTPVLTQTSHMTTSRRQRGEKQYECGSFIVRQDLSNTLSKKVESPKRTPTYSISRLEELSKPRPNHCLMEIDGNRQRLKTNALSKQSCDEFVARQETMEASRRMKRERRRRELEYEAKVDKKKCPKCGNVQSFDEMVEDRKCPVDGAKYVAPRQFDLHRFEKRMFESRCKRQQTLEEIKEERIKTLYRAKRTHQQKAILKADGQHFLKRMRDDLMKRKQTIDDLRRKMIEKEQESLSFKPRVKTLKNINVRNSNVMPRYLTPSMTKKEAGRSNKNKCHRSEQRTRKSRQRK